MHIACFSIIRCFIGRLCIALRINIYISWSAFVHRVVGIPLSSELDKFSSPWLEKDPSSLAKFEKKLCWKQLLSPYFHPFEPFAYRIATTSSCFPSHFSSWNASNCNHCNQRCYVVDIRDINRQDARKAYFQLTNFVSYKKKKQKVNNYHGFFSWGKNIFELERGAYS